jgi:hypothetical protein
MSILQGQAARGGAGREYKGLGGQNARVCGRAKDKGQARCQQEIASFELHCSSI